MRSRSLPLLVLTTLLAILARPRAAGAVEPHNSWRRLTTGNGYGFATYDADARRVNFFAHRPYSERVPGEPTRDLAYDAFFGVRALGGAAWLTDRPVDALEYRDQTHV